MFTLSCLLIQKQMLGKVYIINIIHTLICKCVLQIYKDVILANCLEAAFTITIIQNQFFRQVKHGI